MSWCLTHFKQDSSQIILTSFTNICTRIYKSNNRFPIVILLIRYKCWNNKCDVHKLFWYIKSLFRYATIKTIKWIVICIFFYSNSTIVSWNCSFWNSIIDLTLFLKRKTILWTTPRFDEPTCRRQVFTVRFSKFSHIFIMHSWKCNMAILGFLAFANFLISTNFQLILVRSTRTVWLVKFLIALYIGSISKCLLVQMLFQNCKMGDFLYRKFFNLYKFFLMLSIGTQCNVTKFNAIFSLLHCVKFSIWCNAIESMTDFLLFFHISSNFFFSLSFESAPQINEALKRFS